MKKTLKRLILGLVLLSVLGLLYYFLGKTPARLEVDFLDVGQGDATLIKTPDHHIILIDGGPDNTVLRRLGEDLPANARRLDLIISSHYHEDHATGLVAVAQRYKVGEVAYQADSPHAPTFDALLAAAKKQGSRLDPIAKATIVQFSPSCVIYLWPPLIFKAPTDPNNSLVAKLDCAGKKFLFSGDNSSKMEKLLLASGLDLRADVFKASHHGSNTANSGAFLEALRPSLVVISVGANNTFHQPSPLVLSRLKEMGIKFKRTDENQTVKIFSQ